MKYQQSHLENWRNISKPKFLAGWGLKDGLVFGCALAAKYLWVFLMQYSLQRKILIDKFIAPTLVVEWI
jgi:hypothetical protein